MWVVANRPHRKFVASETVWKVLSGTVHACNQIARRRLRHQDCQLAEIRPHRFRPKSAGLELMFWLDITAMQKLRDAWIKAGKTLPIALKPQNVRQVSE
jgi:hypothetical protein